MTEDPYLDDLASGATGRRGRAIFLALLARTGQKFTKAEICQACGIDEEVFHPAMGVARAIARRYGQNISWVDRVGDRYLYGHQLAGAENGQNMAPLLARDRAWLKLTHHLAEGMDWHAENAEDEFERAWAAHRRQLFNHSVEEADSTRALYNMFLRRRQERVHPGNDKEGADDDD